MIDKYSESELMVCCAARGIKNGETVFVGIGLPNMAVNLAKRVYAPGIKMIYEAGVFGANPRRLPLSIGDPCLVTGSTSVCSILDIFMFYLQRGLIDAGFLGGAQIDRFGNINSTVIGDYGSPKVRLPGSGGACEISILAKRVIIIIKQSKRSFPERVDFVTSPGFIKGGKEREKLELPGKGPEMVITDLGMYNFDELTREMVLVSLHPGVEIKRVRENTGWEMKISDNLKITKEPTEEETRVLRELDPRRIYLK